MPLTPGAARALREVTAPELYLDEADRRYARALAWLGHTVRIHFRFGYSVTGVVAGVATIPHLKLRATDSGVLLVRRGSVDVDVLEGYILGTITHIEEASSYRPALPEDERRDRFD